MRTLLVIRFSSLGDVAITVPPLYSVAQQYPDCRFVVLTRKPFDEVFVAPPSNLEVIALDFRGADKGLTGLYRALKQIRLKYSIGAVADLHGVLRSYFTDVYFFLHRKKFAIIDKGRAEKSALCRDKCKKLRPLSTSLERYRQVFSRLGYDAPLHFVPFFQGEGKTDILNCLPDDLKASGVRRFFGIAPFARHTGKTLPEEKTRQLLAALEKWEQTAVFLIGGKDDRPRLDQWAAQYANTVSLAGKYPLAREMQLMAGLDVMVSMDSANMHLASLAGVPVVSVWGATHVFAGFGGFQQKEENCIGVNLACRPCSVFGAKPCYLGTYECMQRIEVEDILEAIRRNLKAH